MTTSVQVFSAYLLVFSCTFSR